jgi:hypothetical protein
VGAPPIHANEVRVVHLIDVKPGLNSTSACFLNTRLQQLIFDFMCVVVFVVGFFGGKSGVVVYFFKCSKFSCLIATNL